LPSCTLFAACSFALFFASFSYSSVLLHFVLRCYACMFAIIFSLLACVDQFASGQGLPPLSQFGWRTIMGSRTIDHKKTAPTGAPRARQKHYFFVGSSAYAGRMSRSLDWKLYKLAGTAGTIDTQRPQREESTSCKPSGLSIPSATDSGELQIPTISSGSESWGWGFRDFGNAGPSLSDLPVYTEVVRLFVVDVCSHTPALPRNSAMSAPSAPALLSAATALRDKHAPQTRFCPEKSCEASVSEKLEDGGTITTAPLEDMARFRPKGKVRVAQNMLVPLLFL
jgi:hypothetical protein